MGVQQELYDRIMNGKTLNVNVLSFSLKILIHGIKEAWMEFLNKGCDGGSRFRRHTCKYDSTLAL